MGKQGQVAMEYIAIVALVMVITGPLLVVFYKSTASTEETIDTNQVSMIANKIADAAQSVYYLGDGAKSTLKVYMPKNVQSVSIGNNEVTFTMRHQGRVSDFVAYVPVNITGNISSGQGIRFIVIESNGTYVEVSDQ